MLFAKTYGAQKIYCVRQTDSESKEDVMDKEAVEATKREYDELVSVIANETASLESLRRKASLGIQHRQLQEKELFLLDKIKSMHKQIALLEASHSSQGAFSQMGDELRLTFDKMSLEFTKRRRLANELLGYLTEAADISRRDLVEELGLETIHGSPSSPTEILSPSRGC